MKQYIIYSNTQLLSDIKLLLNKKNLKKNLPTDEVSEEPSRKKKYDSNSNIEKSNAYESTDFRNISFDASDINENIAITTHFLNMKLD